MPKESYILTLRPETFAAARLPVATSWLLSDCMEFRGKQDLWVRQRPETLEALKRQAMIESVESSNRIEGVTVSSDRLRPLVLGHARPRDRSEEELAGYRRALDWIYSRRSPVEFDARTVLHLHRLSHASAGDAGAFKSRDNEIIEIRPTGEHVLRFKPLSAKQTPAAIARLGAAYRHESQNQKAPPLLLIATAVFDFLCIHPFRDGNGRVSRLLTTLLLEQHGFAVARFISLERLVEQTREDYYHALATCSKDWAAGDNKILPWWNYFLTIIRRAYGEFSARVENTGPRPGKSALARDVILAQIGPFSLTDIRAQLASVSDPLLKKILTTLKAEGKIKLVGRGRGARWNVI